MKFINWNVTLLQMTGMTVMSDLTLETRPCEFTFPRISARGMLGEKNLTILILNMVVKNTNNP